MGKGDGVKGGGGGAVGGRGRARGVIGVEGGHGFCALVCEFERSRNHLLS